MPRDEQKVSERSQPMTPSPVVPSGEPPLSPQRAFVVQFRAGPAPWVGRVEHTVSGQATRFRSAEELWAFFARVFTEGEEKSA